MTHDSKPMATLLTGLGNPGLGYSANRHNIGFMAIDRIRSDYGFTKFASRFGGLASEGIINSQKIFLLKPMGYMNNSGQPVGELARFYKIPAASVTVLHDELDLPLGKLRVKRGGGHGGHNGLKSIDAHIGREYERVRLGIGHPGDKELVTPHVLSDFVKTEKLAVELLLSEVSRHIGLLLQGDEAGFMNKVALAIKGD